YGLGSMNCRASQNSWENRNSKRSGSRSAGMNAKHEQTSGYLLSLTGASKAGNVEINQPKSGGGAREPSGGPCAANGGKALKTGAGNMCRRTAASITSITEGAIMA